MFPLSLVKIGQIVKKWQPCFEIQDGSGRHLEFLKLCISDVAVPMFSKILVTIGQIIEKWKLFFQILYGDDRRREFAQICISDIH